MTGSEPKIRSQVYALRGPMRSESQPSSSRATIVTATEAMIELPTWSLVRCNSLRTTGISGAIPNQPKKHTKNASHVM